MPDPTPSFDVTAAHKWFAVECNNACWPTLEPTTFVGEDAEKLLNQAHAAVFHWRQIGKPVNVARGNWLLARVNTVLGRKEAALHHAQLCLDQCLRDGFKDWDLAFAYEAAARANALAGNMDAARAHYADAVTASAACAEKEDREIVDGDLATGPWFGMR